MATNGYYCKKKKWAMISRRPQLESQAAGGWLRKQVFEIQRVHLFRNQKEATWEEGKKKDVQWKTKPPR